MSQTLPPAPKARPVLPKAGLGLASLTAIVVGSMIGSGIFALPSQTAGVASPGPLLIGWVVTGVGMLMLAFVFQTLASRKPDVDGELYGYADAGFGNYIGFTSEVEAACGFARNTGNEAVIGALADITQIVGGTAGTRVRA
jgi:arginine:ornithine antiporter / lysine permease